VVTLTDAAIIGGLDPDQRTELHDELCGAAREIVGSCRMQEGIDDEARRRLARAAELLERAVVLQPDDWDAYRGLGTVWRMLDDHERAYQAFERAYELGPPGPATATDLSGECIALGKGAEAVTTARRACELDPADPGLVANLALAYLIDGQIEAARTTAAEAQRRDPGDRITEVVAVLAEGVAAGQVVAPTRWPP